MPVRVSSANPTTVLKSFYGYCRVRLQRRASSGLTSPPALITFGGFRKTKPVPERVRNFHHSPPWYWCNRWLGIPVLLRLKLETQSIDIFHRHENCRTRCAVPVVLTQVDYQFRTLYLRIEGKVISKPVLPFKPETKKIQIKFLRLFLREDAQDGDGGR